MEMFRRTFAEINLDNLKHNIQIIQQTFPNRFLCPMLKANAYGHGDVQLALFLETLGVEHVGVCLIEEGLLMRQSGVKADILVFRGFDREGAEKIVQYGMTPVVSTWDQIEHLEAVAQAPISIHLKFDTGMNRLGFNTSEAQKVFDRLWQNKKIRVKAILTHLYSGEDAFQETGHSAQQLIALNNVLQIFKPMNIFAHALNSAGIVNLTKMIRQQAFSVGHPLLLTDWGLRPGLMIYGYNPLEDEVSMDLKPVMNLKSIVGSYRHLKKGDTVSYSARWTAQRDSVIGVVPIGYADGYHRVLSNQGHVLFAGRRVPVVGTVCMDYLMIDVTDIVKDQDLNRFKEQEVILFGGDGRGHFVSAEELAHKARTITWEILTSVGERVPRVFVGMEAHYVGERVGGRL